VKIANLLVLKNRIINIDQMTNMQPEDRKGKPVICAYYTHGSYSVAMFEDAAERDEEFDRICSLLGGTQDE